MIFADGDIAKRTKASGYTIDRGIVLYNLAVEVLTAILNPASGIVAELEFITFAYYFTDTFYRQVFGRYFMNHNMSFEVRVLSLKLQDTSLDELQIGDYLLRYPNLIYRN